MSATALRELNAILALLGLFLLTVGLVVEWDRLWRPWRRIVVGFLIQQVVIAFGSLEAAHEPSSPTAGVPLRVYGYTMTLCAIILAATLALRAHYRPGPDEYARGIRDSSTKGDKP